jgi:hypothetical protein
VESTDPAKCQKKAVEVQKVAYFLETPDEQFVGNGAVFADFSCVTAEMPLNGV